MKKMYEDVRGFLTRDWTVSEKILIILCCILFGMIKGLCYSSWQKRSKCGCIEDKDAV